MDPFADWIMVNFIRFGKLFTADCTGMSDFIFDRQDSIGGTLCRLDNGCERENCSKLIALGCRICRI